MRKGLPDKKAEHLLAYLCASSTKTARHQLRTLHTRSAFASAQTALLTARPWKPRSPDGPGAATVRSGHGAPDTHAMPRTPK